MKQPSRGEDDEAEREKKREASTEVFNEDDGLYWAGLLQACIELFWAVLYSPGLCLALFDCAVFYWDVWDCTGQS